MKTLGVLLLCSTALPAASVNHVTFNKEVLPVLQKNCQGCHRPGEAAPMSFLTYKETRPYAKAIKAAVAAKKMPPWFADPAHGKWVNDRSMTQPEINTLVAWADTGAAEGNSKEAPRPISFVEGWNIGKPDAIVEMPIDFQVPATGTIAYTYFVMPTNWNEDKWVQLAEVRPGNRALVHHVIAFIREPGSKWMQDAKPGVPFVPNRNGERRSEGNGEWLTGFAPGSVPEKLEPGQGRLVKAGSDIVFQMHYTASGKEGFDRSRVGVIFAKEKPTTRIVTVASQNNKFQIPAGDANYKVESTMTLQADSTLVALLPHMHLRGKDFEYRAVYPTGETQTLLRVPAYSFSWQLSYLPEKPIVLPKGTKIECTAHFDNSANNPYNPDPAKTIRWGDQSWDEMMIGFFNVAIPANMSSEELMRVKRPAPPRTDD